MPGPLHLKIFLSSPGDVAEERELARHLIKDELPYDPLLRGKVTFDVFSWDDPAAGVPLLAGMTPQEAVNRVDRPADCDITIVILWSRLGSPLRTDVFRKPDGEPYGSGTEWEYEDARAASRDVLIYRRTAPVSVDIKASDLEERREQMRRVEEFFARFRNADGSFNAAASSYVAPADLKERLENDLKALVARRLDVPGREVPLKPGTEGRASDKVRLNQVPKPPEVATSEAEQSVAGTWFGMTVLQATALLGMIVAYLGALGAVFRWFGDDFKSFREQDPWLFWPLTALPLLFIAAFSVGPKLLVHYRRKRRERLALGADTTVPSAGYFRLDPYTADQPESFNRADGAHERILRWLRATPRPVLFLSGASGTGKSSLLEAYVLPSLEQEGWHVEVVRSFADPLEGLEVAVCGRRGGKAPPLLVVFDQFEEFVILEGRAASEAGRRFLTRVQELRERSPPGVHLLFVVRSDYLNAIVELGIEELASGQSWQEIDPFKRRAARAFLENSPLRPSAELLERLLDGAEALEEAKGLFRPVTLNMLGLTLQDFDRQVTRRPERLVQAYLEAALAQVGIREIAPKVVAGLISEAGTKRPRELGELADEARLSRSEVKLCLARLAAKGLVRPLDEARSLWEISHDFVAKQLAILLGRLRPNPWPRVALWSTPFLFALALGALLFVVPLQLEKQTLTELKRSGASVSEDQGRPKLSFDRNLNNARLQAIAPFIIRYKTSILDLSGTGVTDLAPLQGLSSLQTLNLSNTGVTDLAPLQGLSSLQTLNLSNTGVTDLAPLQGLSSLQRLDLSDTGVTDLAPLQGLSSLQSLNLTGTKVTDLVPLQGLSSLQTLNLSNTGVTDLVPLQGLSSLQTLNLIGTKVTDLAPLQGLSSLQRLNLTAPRSPTWSRCRASPACRRSTSPTPGSPTWSRCRASPACRGSTSPTPGSPTWPRCRASPACRRSTSPIPRWNSASRA